MKKIVIEIDDELYNEILSRKYSKTRLEKAVANGTPLPEHHGRLIDADRLTRTEIMPFWYHLPNGDIACPKIDIDHAPTIVEGSETNETDNIDM